VIVAPTAIPEVLRLDPTLHTDDRGFFVETWHAGKFRRAGLDWNFVQDNHSRSVRGTLRGLHYQVERPQGKLVWVVSGEVYDVAVDLRRSAPTFGRWVADILSADNHRQLWVPPGFAHGFYVMSEQADVIYKCTEPYSAPHDRTLRWDDPDLAITWPISPGARPLLSDKDARGHALAGLDEFA
jgi:dTDP-4-dehydrorhamnose 3,5-epimerase